MKSVVAKYLVGAVALSLTVSGPASSADSKTTLKTQILIGQYGSKWSYDFSDLDPVKGIYFLTDRNSKAVDMIDVHTNVVVAKIPGFTGFKGKPEISGPNAIERLPGSDLAFVSDVNSVKVVDLAKRAIVNSIAVPNTKGNRIDGGCLDATHKVAMFVAADDEIPSVYFISTDAQKIIGNVKMPGASGLEGCQYEPTTQSFYLDVPSDKEHPGGLVAVFAAADAAAGSPKIAKTYPLTGCEPAGNALGPVINGKPQLAIACDPTDDGKEGDPMFTLVMNVMDGSVVKIAETGGGDQIAYNSKWNKYYLAARNWYPSGKVKVGPIESVLGIINAGSATAPPSFDENVPTCLPKASGGCKSGAHSVASDSGTGRTFVPVGTPGASVINVYGQ
ncbi:MAG: hypothetical protein M3R53_07800 [Candidatus Eremiobacteraeota bacterium]|nr:hypothetical protein [Candidatus Eremiobacteraeota bacterium]